MTQKEYVKTNSTSYVPKILQHRSFEAANALTIRNYTINVDNKGDICPRACKTNVTIRNAMMDVVWFLESNSTFVMAPVIFDLNYTLGVYGFVFKLWRHEEKVKVFLRFLIFIISI